MHNPAHCGFMNSAGLIVSLELMGYMVANHQRYSVEQLCDYNTHLFVMAEAAPGYEHVANMNAFGDMVPANLMQDAASGSGRFPLKVYRKM